MKNVPMHAVQSPGQPVADEPTRSRKWGPLLLKAVLSVLAISYLIWRTDWPAVGRVMSRARVEWLLAAVLAYNSSQITSTFRLKTMLRGIGIQAPFRYLLPLYYTGMAYNLFLPGGIGGDGYKAVRLRNKFGVGYRLVLSTLLLDRLLGLLAILVLGCLAAGFSTSVQALLPVPPGIGQHWIGLIAAGFVVVVAYIGVRLVFRRFKTVFWPGVAVALGVQTLQLLGCTCLLMALRVSSHLVDYLLTFLASSIAAALPLTIGGIGMRELVFVQMSQWLPIRTPDALATSLLFYLVAALSSLQGFWVKQD